MEWAFTEVEKSVKGAGFDELHGEFAFGHVNVEMLDIWSWLLTNSLCWGSNLGVVNVWVAFKAIRLNDIT